MNELFPKPYRQNMRMRAQTKNEVPVGRVVKDPLKVMVAGGMTGYGLSELLQINKNKIKMSITNKYNCLLISSMYFEKIMKFC